MGDRADASKASPTIRTTQSQLLKMSVNLTVTIPLEMLYAIQNGTSFDFEEAISAVMAAVKPLPRPKRGIVEDVDDLPQRKVKREKI